MSVLDTHSVQFSSNNVDFDVVALSDLSGTMTSSFTFKDIFYQKGFANSDSSATAVVDVVATDYNNLFKLNIPIYDPASGVPNTDLVRYLTKGSGWKSVNFSNAVVSTAAEDTTNSRGPIFTSHNDQSIKKDFLRSMLFDITGSTRLNNLFKNQQTMISHIEGLDTSFNAEVNALLNQIEGAGWLTDADYGVLQSDEQTYSFNGIFRDYTTDPTDLTSEQTGVSNLSASTFSKFNPLRILSSSILGEEDADDSDAFDISGTGLGNSTRREVLINSLKTQVESFWNEISQNEYSAVDVNSTQYRVWLTSSAASQEASLVDGNTFSTYLDGYNLYAVAGTSTDNSGSLIAEVVDKEYNFLFQPGDKLHVLITYKPQESQFDLLSGNPPVKDRTYEVVLNMT